MQKNSNDTHNSDPARRAYVYLNSSSAGGGMYFLSYSFSCPIVKRTDPLRTLTPMARPSGGMNQPYNALKLRHIIHGLPTSASDKRVCHSCWGWGTVRYFKQESANM